MVELPAPRVLLIGWETADWPLVDPVLAKGWMPHLAKLIAQGQRATLLHRPPLQPAALWSTLLTGVGPLVHHVVADREMRPDGSGYRPIGRSVQHATPLWQRLEAAGIPTAVVGFPATHPAERLSSASVSDVWLTAQADEQDASVRPGDLRDTLNLLRIAPEEIDLATLRAFLPNASDITANDPRPVILRKCLAQTASWHAVATAVVERTDWRFAAVHYPGLGPLCRGFLPYHAPVARDVADRDARCYGEVVTAAYRFHDMMLGRLIELAGDDTVVVLVSNHGVLSGPDRFASTPKTMTHTMSGLRREAIAVIAGPPSIQRAQPPSIIPATDLASIVLALFGVDSSDQTQRPLADHSELPVDVVENQRPVEDRSATYLLSLGYVEQPDGYARAAARRLEADKKHVLAMACQEYGQTHRAIGILEKLIQQFPNTTDYAISLAELYASAGKVEAFTELVDRLARAYPESPIAMAGLGIAAMLGGEREKAAEILKNAGKAAERIPWLLAEIGRAMARMEYWQEGIEMFTRAIALDDQLADAHAGLASARLACGDVEAAVTSSQKAVSIRPYDPEFMRQLGEALMADGQDAQARRWLENALRQDPDSVRIMHTLVRLYERTGDQTQAKDLRGRLLLTRFHHAQRRHPGFDTALRIRG